jgi:hypothetical protein
VRIGSRVRHSPRIVEGMAVRFSSCRNGRNNPRLGYYGGGGYYGCQANVPAVALGVVTCVLVPTSIITAAPIAPRAIVSAAGKLAVVAA